MCAPKHNGELLRTHRSTGHAILAVYRLAVKPVKR